MSDEAERDRFQWGDIKDHVRDIVLVIDAHSGALLDANRVAERSYGYSRAELLARTVYDLRVVPAVEVRAQMRDADEAGILFETVHRRADGTTFPVEVSSRGETLGGRRVLVSVIRDITERRRADAERERLLATTQQALAAREEFLLVASHELRTPIAVVGLQLHQLRRMIERGGERDRARTAVDTAIRQVDRLDQLVGILLDVTRIASGQLELERTDVDLRDLVAEVVSRAREQADHAGSSITTAVAPVVGRWDRLRLDQALTNLIGNAIKYGEGRQITVTGHADGDAAVIEVADHGIGLAEDDRARIFEKFARAVPLSHYGGLGLGLYITRQIAEAHGGTVEVDSELGVGSTFRLTLPRGT